MKKLLPILLLSLFVAGCKTTEANYRTAYESAAARRAQTADAELDFLGIPDRSVMQTLFLTPVKIADTDTVTPAQMPRFGVAANKFRQVFNAKALCGRLREGGWPDAFVARSSDDDYWVILRGFAGEAAAREFLGQVSADKEIPFGRGFPAAVRAAWK